MSKAQRNHHQIAYEGSQLSQEQAAALERKLVGNPSDADLRIKLLGFYVLGSGAEA